MDSRALLECLLDNSRHSGGRLATQAGVSRTAIWQGIKRLRRLGLTISAKHGKGYRLEDSVELLDETALRRELGPIADALRLAILFDTDSTNNRLTASFGNPDFHGRVVLAEHQRAGKGRRGRTWASPLAGGLCLSIGWRFDAPPASLNALSLACGVAVIDALEGMGVSGLGLKWPNDIMRGGGKLGGILLESRSETAATCDVAIGIGLNIRLPESVKAGIDQPVSDLHGCFHQAPSRNRLAGKIIAEQLSMLTRVAEHGMGEYLQKWRTLDCLAGRRARLSLPGRALRGEVRGVDDNGLLLMKIDGGPLRTFSSGELSLRAEG